MSAAAVASIVLASVAGALLVPAAPVAARAAPAGGRGAAAPSVAARSRILGSVLAAVSAGYLFGGWWALVAAPAAGALVWRFLGRLEGRAERRRRERLRRQLPHTVDLLAATLAAGSSPSAAAAVISEAVDAPMREELAGIAARLMLGVDPVRVWAEVGCDRELGSLGRCLVRAVETGASVSDAMLRLAEDLRRDSRAETEELARSVGVRAAMPLGLCLLPAFVLTGVVPLVAGSLARLSGL